MKVVDHQPGHIGCCSEDGGYGDNTFGFSFVPGQAQPIATPANIPASSKRSLSVDEFEFYYRMLNDPVYSDHAKIAIAMVLKADMMRLYKNTPNYQPDEYLELWVAKFNSLTPALKQSVYGEVAAFDNFLQTSKMSDFYPPNMLPFIQAAEEYEINANEHSLELEAAMKQAEDERNRQIEYIRHQAMNDLKAAVEEFDLTMTSDQEAFIRKNFADYLHAIETDMYANIALDQVKNNAKEQIYQKILDRYNNGEINYDTAMTMYADELEKINNTSISSLIFRKDYQHPILKYVGTKK